LLRKPFPGNDWQPVIAMWRIASNSLRTFVVQGLPVLLQSGIKVPIEAHCA